MNHKGSSTLQYNRLISKVKPSRGMLFGLLILGALLAFELFNYSTTDFALTDLLGDLRFAGVRWAAILAVAFCGIDFAGIARLFTPERGTGQPKEVWYLFGAWLLAATMNAMLTYWGVAIAILSHPSLGSAVLSQVTLLQVVPVFVAIMVWLIRVLIIGSFSVAGNRLFSQPETQPILRSHHPVHSQPMPAPNKLPAQPATLNPAPKTGSASANSAHPGAEPTYHPLSMSGNNSHRPQSRK
jgi:hypothetical protein